MSDRKRSSKRGPPSEQEELTRDLASFLAVDLPNPMQYALAMCATLPELAAVVMTARFTRVGWRIRLPADDPALAQLRSLGVVEVRGFEPSASDRVAGLGTHLSNFGADVYRALWKLKRGAEQLREAEERDAAE